MIASNLSTEELVLAVDNDSSATERERLLAERLSSTMQYIAEVTLFLARNDMLEPQQVLIQ